MKPEAQAFEDGRKYQKLIDDLTLENLEKAYTLFRGSKESIESYIDERRREFGVLYQKYFALVGKDSKFVRNLTQDKQDIEQRITLFEKAFF